MPETRRTFLTLAGASVGLIATGGRAVQALDHGGFEEPPQGGRALERSSLATIVGLAGAELVVRVEASGETFTLEPRDFGDWTHQVGDRVVVAEDPAGHRSVKPYVLTVNAPLPRGLSRVEIGSVIQIGERSARITSERVREAVDAIRARSSRAEVHWLLSENAQTGELRIFGLMDGK